MAHITLEIKDNSQIPFFMELVKNLKFVKKVEVDEKTLSKKEVLDGLKEAVAELNEILAGKKKGKDAFHFLNEL